MRSNCRGLAVLFLHLHLAGLDHGIPKLLALRINGRQLPDIGERPRKLAIAAIEDDDIAVAQRVPAPEVKLSIAAGAIFYEIEFCRFLKAIEIHDAIQMLGVRDGIRGTENLASKLFIHSRLQLRPRLLQLSKTLRRDFVDRRDLGITEISFTSAAFWVLLQP